MCIFACPRLWQPPLAWFPGWFSRYTAWGKYLVYILKPNAEVVEVEFNKVLALFGWHGHVRIPVSSPGS